MMEEQNVLHHVCLATDEIPLNLLQKYYLTNRDCCASTPYRAYISRGDLTEGFLRYEFGGLIYLEGLIFGILRYDT